MATCIVTFSEFDINLCEDEKGLDVVVEALIRSAHGEAAADYPFPEIPEYRYFALACSKDEDLKEYESLLECQRRKLESERHFE